MARSAESTAREAIRARSSPKHVGRRSMGRGSSAATASDGGGGGDGCLTGHPAFASVTPAFELERMPEGGGYPTGLIELAARLMGVQDLGAVVHLCSGSVRATRTFDIRRESSCAVRGDVRRLPIRSCAVAHVMVDPPYSVDYAEALWGLGKVYPMPVAILRECARILRPGGMVAFLHQVVPNMPEGLERVATYGVTTGVGYRIRCLTIARRADVGATLFDESAE